MIYSAEQYYRSAFGELAASASDLSHEKITMAVMLASHSPRKSGLDFESFLSMASTAEEFGCLSVYVNFYGRPVSYVMWGYCDRSGDGEVSEVRFSRQRDLDELYLIDFETRENSVDETIALWAGEMSAKWITVRRPDRPRQMRTYSRSRLTRFAWRVAQIEGRFASPKGHGIAEYEASSKDIIDQYKTAQLVLEAIGSASSTTLKITTAVPLIVDLLSIDQCRFLIEEGMCSAVLIIALSDARRWRRHGDVNLFELPLRSFVDGTDIIIAGVYGRGSRKQRIVGEFLAQLQDPGDREVYLPTDAFCGSPLGGAWDQRGSWAKGSCDVDEMIRLVRS